MIERFKIGNGRFQPWLRDPLIELAKANTSIDFEMVAPNELADFINPKVDSCATQIIHGPKGAGKSSVILAKRLLLEQAIRNKELHALCVPHGFPYVFAPLDPAFEIRFDQWDLFQIFSDRASWRWLWLVLLGSFVMTSCERSFRLDVQTEDGAKTEKLLPIELGKFLLGESYPNSADELHETSFSDVLKTMISVRKAKPQQLEQLYIKFIRPFLQNWSTRASVFVFVDSMDEQFKGINGIPFVRVLKEGMNIVDSEARNAQITVDTAYDLWAFSQNTLVDAALVFLADSGGKVKLIGTMRSEAYGSPIQIGKSRAQLGNLVKRITYSREHLQEIFELNIEKCSKDKLVTTVPNSPDRLVHFFGKTSIRHWKVRDESERIIDGIIRHTFENPRELMEIGDRLYTKISKEERQTREKAAEQVNLAAKQILTDHLEFLGENFDESVRQYCFPLIGTNVLSAAEVHKIELQAASDSNQRLTNPFSHLYRLGLVGIPRETSAGLRQYFMINTESTDDHGMGNEYLPSATHYLIHPALACLIADHRGGYGGNQFVTNSQVIVGNGCKWNPSVGVGRVVLTYERTCNRPNIVIDGIALSERLPQKATFSTFSDRATVLLVAILLALADDGTETTTVENVLNQIEKMAHNKLILDSYRGYGRHSQNAKEYFQYHIAESKGHPSLFESPRVLRRQFCLSQAFSV
jgi:hypothetical protein